MGQSPWYANAFNTEYLRIYAHRSDAQAAQQVAAMQACGLLPQSGRVLDIACGAGRHLRALRHAGLRAFGLDYSMDLLRAGTLTAMAVRADMRAIPFADATFDWACSLFTSFGYFETAQEDQRMFAGAARVLKPGASLVLDHINPVVTLRDLKPESIDERDGTRLVQRRRHDASAGLVIKDIEFTAQGQTRRWQERVRLYQPEDLGQALKAAGFSKIARFGDLDGQPWREATSPRQVVLASR